MKSLLPIIVVALCFSATPADAFDLGKPFKKTGDWFSHQLFGSTGHNINEAANSTERAAVEAENASREAAKTFSQTTELLRIIKWPIFVATICFAIWFPTVVINAWKPLIPVMKPRQALIVSSVACLLLGILLSAYFLSGSPADRVNDTIATAWQPGKDGKLAYGAQVYVESNGAGYSVRARVRVGHDNEVFHDCGALGNVDTFEQAVQKWGKIDWRPDGLHIATYFVPLAQLEATH